MSIARIVDEGRVGPTLGPPKLRYRRDFSQEYRLTCRSLPEICEKVKRVVARFGLSRRVQFRGRKLTNEAFINAATLYVSELDRDTQEMILGAYVARIEMMMQDDPFGVVSLPD